MLWVSDTAAVSWLKCFFSGEFVRRWFTKNIQVQGWMFSRLTEHTHTGLYLFRVKQLHALDGRQLSWPFVLHSMPVPADLLWRFSPSWTGCGKCAAAEQTASWNQIGWTRKCVIVATMAIKKVCQSWGGDGEMCKANVLWVWGGWGGVYCKSWVNCNHSWCRHALVWHAAITVRSRSPVIYCNIKGVTVVWLIQDNYTHCVTVDFHRKHFLSSEWSAPSISQVIWRGRSNGWTTTRRSNSCAMPWCGCLCGRETSAPSSPRSVRLCVCLCCADRKMRTTRRYAHQTLHPPLPVVCR